MEQKNIDTNGDNVVAKNLNNFNFYVFFYCKDWVKIEHQMQFFLKDVMIA